MEYYQPLSSLTSSLAQETTLESIDTTLSQGTINVNVSGTVGELDTNLTEVGGAAISLGQKVMASSLPVTLASDQSNLPISISSLTLTDVDTTGGGQTSALIVDTQLTNIAQETGGNLAAINTSTASLDSKQPTLGQKTGAGSIPVVVASDQTVSTSDTTTHAKLDNLQTPIDVIQDQILAERFNYAGTNYTKRISFVGTDEADRLFQSNAGASDNNSIRVCVANDQSQLTGIQNAVEILDDTVKTMETDTYTSGSDKATAITGVMDYDNIPVADGDLRYLPLKMTRNSELRIDNSNSPGTTTNIDGMQGGLRGYDDARFTNTGSVNNNSFGLVLNTNGKTESDIFVYQPKEDQDVVFRFNAHITKSVIGTAEDSIVACEGLNGSDAVLETFGIRWNASNFQVYYDYQGGTTIVNSGSFNVDTLDGTRIENFINPYIGNTRGFRIISCQCNLIYQVYSSNLKRWASFHIIDKPVSIEIDGYRKRRIYAHNVPGSTANSANLSISRLALYHKDMKPELMENITTVNAPTQLATQLAAYNSADSNQYSLWATQNGILGVTSNSFDKVYFNEFLKNGATVNAVQDYSVTAGNFDYVNASSTDTYFIESLTIIVTDAGKFEVYNKYGALNQLTNGLQLLWDRNGETQVDLTADKTITDFNDLFIYAPDFNISPDLKTTYFNWYFKTPLVLTKSASTDRLRMVLNDDFTGLDGHYFLIKGYYTSNI